MKPYFDTSHLAGTLTLVAVLCWAMIEAAHLALLTLAGLLWRIHAEERALLTTLGDPYRAYAARHKRLVPLVW